MKKTRHIRPEEAELMRAIVRRNAGEKQRKAGQTNEAIVFKKTPNGLLPPGMRKGGGK